MARWRALAGVLSSAWALGACGPDPLDPLAPPDPPDPDKEVPCLPERTLTVTVSGAVGASDAAVAGVLDASTWRLGDAQPLTTTRARDGGAFTLCLATDPPATHLYEMAFFAAWIDLDADGRLDAGAEPLCDRTDGGSLAEPLYFEDGAWRVGLAGGAGAAVSPVGLDGDRCSR